MSGAGPLRLRALFAGPEAVAASIAAERLSQALTRAAGQPVMVAAPAEETDAKAGFLMTSMLADLEDGEDWPELERTLRRRYAELVQSEAGPVFICTVLRRPSGHEAPEAAREKLIRIRRLNLLAAELSRELGLFVIDIDRDLADIGARALETDYRLGGPFAAEAAARSMALAVLSAGLDDYVAPEVEERARLEIAAWRPACATSPGARPALHQPSLVAHGQGRRRQTVAATVDGVEESRMVWLIQSLLRRRIGLAYACATLLRTLASRDGRAGVARVADRVGRTLGHAWARG